MQEKQPESRDIWWTAYKSLLASGISTKLRFTILVQLARWASIQFGILLHPLSASIYAPLVALRALA